MSSANCTIVGRRTSSGSYELNSTSYVGDGSSTQFYPYWLKFTTPAFSGASQSVLFTLSLMQGYRNGTKSPKVNLRWALCASDANYAKYNTSADVSDSNQIVKGTVSYEELQSSTYSNRALNVVVTGLKPNTDYYLVLWGNNSGGYSGDTATMNAASKHSAVLEYSSGVVRIGDLTSVAYMDTGSGWTALITNKADGTQWEVCV